jgi:hypothetical protein
MGVGEVFASALGLSLFLHSDLREDPPGVFLHDCLITAVPILVGVLLLWSTDLSW